MLRKSFLFGLAVLVILCRSAVAAPAATSVRLDKGWEYYQGDLGGTWELWRGAVASDNVKWTAVDLPHCFNARDAVDPDVPYYQGPGWYRTQLKVDNPYQDGRTLLVFEGAGQKTDVFVNLDQVGQRHIGGYDEFTIDITDAAAKALQNRVFKGKVPVAVRCDNSRDLEMMPSDLSDFVVYGGLYRHVNLMYVPAVSLERVHIEPNVAADGSATAKIRARLYNPSSLDDDINFLLPVARTARRPDRGSP
jgi:beta-galactosidase